MSCPDDKEFMLFNLKTEMSISELRLKLFFSRRRGQGIIGVVNLRERKEWEIKIRFWKPLFNNKRD